MKSEYIIALDTGTTSTKGLLFFPFFGGERSAHYNPSALGVINSIDEVNEYVGHSGFIDFNTGNHTIYRKVCRSYDNIYSRLFL